MTSVTDDSDSRQPPVIVVCQRHLETVLQRVTPSVKVPSGFIGWPQVYHLLPRINRDFFFHKIFYTATYILQQLIKPLTPSVAIWVQL